MEKGRAQTIGKWGEDAACAFLARQGFSVIDRNFHTPAGEIDVVAIRGGDYYFIEVKTRHVGELANDLAITKSKLYKFNKTVKAYCFKRNILGGSLIVAGLLVTYERSSLRVTFRLAPIY